MAEEKDIKYINREFGDFKAQLIEFAKNYFPDTYNDFTEASPGAMFIEMAAYVGDVLSFYTDTQLQESFLQHAQNPSNLYSLAYMMGYRPKVSNAAEVELEVSQRVQASGSNFLPDFKQALKLSDNTVSTSTSTGNQTFIHTKPIDFKFSSSFDPTDIQIYSLENGQPEEYLLTKKVRAFSGEIKTYSKEFTTAEKFATIEIQDTDIIKVLDITDSDGNVWYEVPYLGQDTIFIEESNTGDDRDITPSIMKLQSVPRRFVSRFTSKEVLQVQFGSGVVIAKDEEFLPDPTFIKKYGDADTINKFDISYDPSNFLFTRTYGLAPNNTTLTIRYITGGGVTANVPANTITDITTTPTGTDTTYASTITCNNPTPASGGKDGDTVEELRQNSLRSYGEQKRAVTLQDFTVRAASLPFQFGTVAKTFVTRELTGNSDRSVLDKNPLALAMYVLAYDGNGKLTTAGTTVKNNLQTYLSQYMLLTDALDIKDAFIVNIGVKFEILTLPNYASRDVLLSCTTALKDYFKISKWSINQPINLSSIYTLLDKIKGVQTVKKVYIENKQGGNYSQYAYDVKGATKDNIVYPSYDPSIFEVKFPNTDIEGRVTNI